MSKHLKLLTQNRIKFCLRWEIFTHFWNSNFLVCWVYVNYQFFYFTSICLKYYSTQLSCQVLKKVAKKFSFSKLKLKKENFLLWVQYQIFSINAFNVGGCLASCSTFRLFLKIKNNQENHVLSVFLRLGVTKHYTGVKIYEKQQISLIKL